mgnify:CR=1 FL=1
MTEDWEFTQKEAARSMLANYKLGIADSWIKALTEILTNSHQSFHSMMDDGHVFKEKPKIKRINLDSAAPGRTLDSLTEAEREVVNKLLRMTFGKED